MTTAGLSHAKIRILSNINWKAMCFVSFFLCLALLLFYVWQVRYLTSGSYVIGSYQAQIAKLSGEKKDLEVNFAESSFLGQVQTKIKELSFQKTTSIKYIQIPDNSLAKAK
jgi:hypothetical protein